MASYGTVPAKGAPLLDQDVERMQNIRVQNSLSELVQEVKFGRSLLMTALFVTVLMCLSTFTMVVLATRYSADTVIVNGVMTEKATNNVVATAEHQQIIDEPLSIRAAQGVKRVTISRRDGSLISHRVESTSRVNCKKASDSISGLCAQDGFAYLFETARGTYAGTNDNGLKFTLLDETSVDSLKQLGAIRPKLSMATGKQL